jgi:putative peptidoglycan lipid II flippase
MATLKDVIVARQFGSGDSMDAFFIAYLLPAFAVNVLVGSFNLALVPTYIQVREREGKVAAQQLLSTAMVWIFLLLIAVSILIGSSASYILPALGSGFGTAKLVLTRRLLLILLPILPISGLVAIWAAILNAGGRFALAAVTPVVTSLAAIILVSRAGSVWGISALALALVVGGTLECLLLASELKRRGISIVPHWYGLTPAIRQIIKQYLPMIAACFITSGTLLVDQSMAAMLGPGSVSVLNYGNKVTSLVIAVSSVALGTAVLPQFSQMVAARNWIGIRHTIRTYVPLIAIVTIPLTLACVSFSHPVVSLLFQRGAFTAGDTLRVAPVQSLYALQLPFYTIGIFFVPLLSALKANHVFLLGAGINFIVNITMDYLLMKWYGVSGIALSTSVVYLISLGYLSWMSFHLLRKAELEG